jgi:hypothetical protein
MFFQRVEKMKKTKHVNSVDRRSDLNLSRGLYRPLDKRKSRNEPVLFRLHRGKSRFDVVDEMNDLPASEYQRMHET